MVRVDGIEPTTSAWKAGTEKSEYPYTPTTYDHDLLYILKSAQKMPKMEVLWGDRKS
jgi:hypothetical protein